MRDAPGRPLLRALLAAVALAGLACADGGATATWSRRIVGGSDDPGDPAVVTLTDYMGNQFCTGTLVSPHVVLTAAHCIDPALPGGAPPTVHRVFFGSDAGTGVGTYVSVTDKQMHPSWDHDTNANDIAVLRIADGAPTAPVPMNSVAFADGFVGLETRLVGFGVTSGTGTDNGVKRVGTTHVSSYTATILEYVGLPMTCYGDSGGPAFITLGGVEFHAGVTSVGDEACTALGDNTRTDAFLAAFIRPYIVAAEGAATCAVDGQCATGCGSPDLDCGPPTITCGVGDGCLAGCTPVDPDCTATCGAGDGCLAGCSPADPDCPVPTCAIGDGCLAGCSPADPDCPVASCAAGDGCLAGCTPADPDCVAAGAPCSQDSDCASLLCIAAVDDPSLRFCSQSCAADHDSCPGDLVCDATTDPAVWLCVHGAPSPGATGWPCGDGTACASGLCVDDGAGSKICSRTCVAAGGADCPLGYACQETDAAHLCLPASAGGGWCAIGGAGRGPGATGVLLAAAALLALRRRRAG